MAYNHQFNAYVISDDAVNKSTASGNVPVILFPCDEAKKLGLEDMENAPTIGFLLGREKGHYSIDYNYAKAICMAGGRIMGLTYTQVETQMAEIDGLVLPGGAFVSPDEFYATRVNNPEEPSLRSKAYLEAIRVAEENAIPILGICAGAQMVAGVHGMKLYRNLNETRSSIEHKTSEVNAHQVIIYPANPLRVWLGKELTVNSRHCEGLIPNDKNSDLKIYAISSDCIPEAWGNMDDGILCVQWHPEDLAVAGNEKMLSIYKWLIYRSSDRRELMDK